MRPFHVPARALFILCAATLSAGPARLAGAPTETGRPLMRYFPPGEHLRAQQSQRTIQASTGEMYFANGINLLRWDGVRWTWKPTTYHSAGIRQFTQAADGTVFVAGAGVIGFVRTAGLDWEFVSLAPQLPPGAENIDEMRSAVAVGDAVYFADDEKILEWRHGVFRVFPFPTPPGSQGARLHRAGNRLYVSALGRGLFSWTEAGPELVCDDRVLHANRIITLNPESDGTLTLLTSEAGLFSLGANGQLQPRETPMNRWLAGKRVFAALRLPDGAWAVGFSGASGDGGLRFTPAGRYAGTLDTTLGLAVQTIRDIQRDREGGLWLAMEQGSARLEWPSPLSLFDTNNGLGSGGVADLVRHEGVLYAGTAEGLFRLAPGDDEQGHMARFTRLGAKEVLSFAVADGVLFALGQEGLYQVEAHAMSQLLRLPAGSRRMTVSTHQADRLWVAAAQGLRALQRTPDGWRDDGIVPGLAEPCLDAHEDAKGNLWVTLAQGTHVARIAPDGKIERLPADTPERPLRPEAEWIRGLPHLVRATLVEITRVHRETVAGEPVLWVGGLGGLVRIDLRQPLPAPVPFAAQVQCRGLPAGGTLPREHELLTFQFAAVRQRPTHRLEYQTRLHGREKDWSDWTLHRERTFAALPPGNYRFDVRARDSDGVLSAPATLSFSVLAPWWQTGWAYFGYGVAALALVGGVVHLRTRSLRRHALHLERIVAERTEELARKNAELVRLHRLEFDEKISARLAEEKARLEMLRYQLNPHFLFNTLVSIRASLPADATTAQGMVERLSDFCRLTLHRSGGGELTNLREEMKLLRVYLEIEQARWGDLLRTQLDCEPAIEETPLPHFLLLPLVENALKYGRATSPDRIEVRVTARSAPEQGLVLEVANTGEWVAPETKGSIASLGIGLDNLRERLARHYPGSHALEITPGAGWVTVTLRLGPLPAR